MSNRKLGAAPCATLPGMFRVSWSCDVEAADHDAAAQAARALQLLGGAAVFSVEQYPDARQGALMLGLGARRVALDPMPDAKRAKPAAAARRVPGSKAGENFRAQPGQVFAEGLRAACRAAVAEHGLGWSFITGASVLLRVPGALASYKSERGTRISIRRDLRAPAARYWPGGEIPPAAVQTPAYVRSWRGKVLCPDGSETPAYRRWLEAWKASPAAHAPTEESRFWAWIAAQPKGDEYRHDPAEQAAVLAPMMAAKFEARDVALSNARQAIGRPGSPNYSAAWARNVMAGQLERARDKHREGMAMMRRAAAARPVSDAENFRAGEGA